MSCALGRVVTHTRSTGEMQMFAENVTFGQNSCGKMQSQWVSVGVQLVYANESNFINLRSLKA